MYINYSPQGRQDGVHPGRGVCAVLVSSPHIHPHSGLRSSDPGLYPDQQGAIYICGRVLHLSLAGDGQQLHEPHHLLLLE